MLHRALDLLRERAASGRPLGVGLVGAGAFGTMLLSQARRLAGLEIVGVADREPNRARNALERAGWSRDELPPVTDDAATLVARDGVDVVVEATGDAVAGVAHALEAIRLGRHVVMVNVEADALAGPVLAARARAAGVVYSLAYGDQPALVCELVDWARATGFERRLRGQGDEVPAVVSTRRRRTTVWAHYGLTPAEVAERRLQPADVHLVPRRHEVGDRDGGRVQRDRARAAGRGARASRPAASTGSRSVCIPRRRTAACCPGAGTVEVVSSLERDGAPVPDDLRWGVYVTFAAPERLRRRLLRGVRPRHRPDRPVRGAVPPVPPHRARNRPSASSRPACSASPPARPTRLRGRRRRDRQARPRSRRDPRRRGRLHGVRRARPQLALAARPAVADRTRPRGRAAPRGRCRRVRRVRRRRASP